MVPLEAADASEQLHKIAIKIFGADPLPGDVSRLRRLLTIASTMAAIEFRLTSEEQEGCKMPKAEREMSMLTLR